MEVYVIVFQIFEEDSKAEAQCVKNNSNKKLLMAQCYMFLENTTWFISNNFHSGPFCEA